MLTLSELKRDRFAAFSEGHEATGTMSRDELMSAFDAADLAAKARIERAVGIVEDNWTADDQDEIDGEENWVEFSEADWAKEPGPRSQRRWKNKKTGQVKYADENPGKGKGRKAAGTTGKSVHSPSATPATIKPTGTPHTEGIGRTQRSRPTRNEAFDAMNQHFPGTPAYEKAKQDYVDAPKDDSIIRGTPMTDDEIGNMTLHDDTLDELFREDPPVAKAIKDYRATTPARVEAFKPVAAEVREHSPETQKQLDAIDAEASARSKEWNDRTLARHDAMDTKTSAIGDIATWNFDNLVDKYGLLGAAPIVATAVLGGVATGGAVMGSTIALAPYTWIFMPEGAMTMTVGAGIAGSVLAAAAPLALVHTLRSIKRAIFGGPKQTNFAEHAEMSDEEIARAAAQMMNDLQLHTAVVLKQRGLLKGK